ncbi:hypothetical protein NCCNTM_49100 [Mycolicibacterium sp. NCC-Tsukiji]|nr:hypothetical protein NCCNTM_49100 [Mycolicibacterium sp. NCC-Tsukiji]
MRSWPAAPRWSLAGQIVALQIAIIIIVVAAGSALAVVQSRRTNDAAAKQLLTGVVTALADAPSTAAAIETGSATEVLQPVTETVRPRRASLSSPSWRPTAPGSPTPTRARSAVTIWAPRSRP